MTKLKFTAKFRNKLSEKLMDLGNLIAVVLVFGQLIEVNDFSWALLFLGIFLTGSCYVVSYMISS